MRNMTIRFALIMIRPADESFEAFVSFRRDTVIKSMQSKNSLIKG